MTTRAPGVPTATAALRAFLVSHFDLDALEVLCFDLAIDYDILPHRTRLELADGLIEHCAGLGQMRQLASAALARRPSVADGPALAAQLDQIPTTPATRVRVQVTLDLDMAAWGDRPMRDVVEHIARLGGVARMEIHALAALPGSVRFLIGVPDTVLPRLLAAPLPQIASGRWKIVRIDPFFALPPPIQAAWQAEFRSHAPGRDPQKRKLNFPKKRGCAAPGLGIAALIAMVVGMFVIIAGTPPGAPPAPGPGLSAPPTRSATPISSPADKATPVITNLNATPQKASTNPACGPTMVTVTAVVSDEGGLARIELHAQLRANPIATGAPNPNVPTEPLSTITQTLSGEKLEPYAGSINLANLPTRLKSGNYASWKLEYWIIAVGKSELQAKSDMNSDVTVLIRCDPG